MSIAGSVKVSVTDSNGASAKSPVPFVQCVDVKMSRVVHECDVLGTKSLVEVTLSYADEGPIGLCIRPLVSGGSAIYCSVVMLNLHGVAGVLYGVLFPTSEEDMLIKYTTMDEFKLLCSLCGARTMLDAGKVSPLGEYSTGHGMVKYGSLESSGVSCVQDSAGHGQGVEVRLAMEQLLDEVMGGVSVRLSVLAFPDRTWHPMEATYTYKWPNFTGEVKSVPKHLHIGPVSEYYDDIVHRLAGPVPPG